MLRKFLQTSVVVLFYPNTRFQIWFGLLLATVSTLGYASLRPYRDAICAAAQQVALLQVVFTFMAAHLFFVEPAQLGNPEPDVGGLSRGSLGWLLVLANCLCFVILVAFVFTTLRESRATAAEVERTFVELGLKVNVLPPRASYTDGTPGYHVFLSQWLARSSNLPEPLVKPTSTPPILR